MATSAGEVEVKLTLVVDEFNKALAQSQKNVQQANDSMLNSVKNFATGIAAAFTATKIISFLNSSLNAFGENQLAVAGLTNALQNQGIASRELVNNLTDTATRLQTLTGTSDDAIISAQTLLTTFGLQGETLNTTVIAALDLAAARHMDLNQAALLLGKAFVGETGALGRFGIKVSESLDPTKKFAAVIGQVNEQMSGRAVANAQTYTGQINIMKESFNDLQKQIGQLLSGSAGGFAKWVTDTSTKLTGFLKNTNETTSGWRSFAMIIGNIVITAMMAIERSIVKLLGLLAEGLAKLPMIGSAFVAFGASVDKANKGIALQEKLLRAALSAALANKDGVVGAESEKQGAVKKTGTTVAQMDAYIAQFQADQAMLGRDAFLASLKDQETGYTRFVDSLVTTTEDLWHYSKEISNEFFEGLGDSFAKSIVEGKNFGESMKNVFRSMAEAMISYIVQIIAKLIVLMALEAATGTGPTGGRLVGAFDDMFAEGGVISEPSVITGLRSGRRTLAGEAGPELVTPMTGDGGMQAAAAGGGGGGITINITGQFLEADENAWGRMLRSKILPEIRRHTMVSPTGNFNRRRGGA